ncbi:T6SS immunity protein Tli4 family protein, partial [Paraburkholderia heleia]|uniref:T6SS immunity protein Tli4 family protein n=1 Tax=Paraburkholderia heleia TaxID=634127 RepID=UPI002AB7EEB7
MGTPNDVPQKTRLLFDLIEKLQGRPEDVIPTVPGVCFIGGFLPGKAVSVDEEIHTDFVLPDNPDVDFNVETFANLEANDTLPQRMKGEEVREAMKAADGRLIRMGSFDLAGGITADEALVAALTLANPPVPGHQFSLEANYKGGALTPYLLLGM